MKIRDAKLTISFIPLLIAIIVLIAVYTIGISGVRKECNKLLTMAKTHSDTLVVYAAKPFNSFGSCSSVLR